MLHLWSRRRSSSLSIAVVFAGLAIAPAPAGAATRVPCPKHAGEVGRSMGSALWVEQGTLYGCAPRVRSKYRVLATPQRTRMRLGPWTDGAVASVRNVDAAWTQRTVGADGSVTDQLWAYDLRRGQAWLRGVNPADPLSTAPGSKTVVAIRAGSDVLTWVTGSGALILRAAQTEDELVDLGIGGVLIGDGDPGVTGAGLTKTLAETHRRVVIGTWPEQVEQLKSSLKLLIDEYVGDAGDAVGCSLTLVWKVVVRPLSDGPRAGATWAANNDELPPDCSRPQLAR